MENKISFYIMNSKGFYVLKNFINKFGSKYIEYVVSCEDKNIKKDYFLEIKELCLKNGINFFNKSDDILHVENRFKGFKFAIGWRWIIKNTTRLVVFHDSLLPKYRGFAPLVNSLINKEKYIGVTALFASNEYDKGDIILQRRIKIDYPIKISEAINKIEPIYFNLVSEIFKNIITKKQFKVIKQDENKATYSVWLDSEDYFIDWNWDADRIKRFIDAVGYPYDNAKTTLNGKIVKIVDAEVISDVIIENRERHIGKVIFFEKEFPIVICKRGLLKLIDIRDKKNNNIKISFRTKFK
ncbi:methionyl-tRNA formyltransferase [Nitrosophilus kaiyonis]|uniref:methionyl-tRNA formyltransferase n=1 Tax=Nitrosophilus kaiyonis TaxID=2930200 RepID=UPI00248FBC3C|nr:formyltransferase family protein [Nitrosophilus kaiyonis]